MEANNDAGAKSPSLPSLGPPGESLVEALARHARTCPEHPAVEDGDRILSYGALQALSNRLAGGLQAAGIKPGDWVVVMLPDSAEHLALLLALARIGAGIASIIPGTTPTDAEQSVAALGAAALIARPGSKTFAGLTLLTVQELQDRRAAPSGPPADPDLPLYCSASSGTTGRPKVIVCTHGRFAAWFDGYRPFHLWSAAHRYNAQIGLSFEFGRGFALGMIQQGATVVFDHAQTLEERIAALRDRRITFVLVTPAHLRRFLQHPVAEPPLFPDMEVLFTSASALSVGENRQVRERLSPNLFQSYATNEVGPLAFARPEDFAARPNAVGRVLPNIETQIVDQEGRPQPTGTVGQVRFRGPDFPDGYLDNPEATARHFRDGWFLPGDLALLDAEGFLHLKGRSDDVIDNQGNKFFPVEVESVLLEHPAVAEAACFGWPHPRFGQVAVACITLHRPMTSEELVAHCTPRLSPYKRPARIVALPSLPKTETGKIIKQELKDLLHQRQIDAGSESERAEA